MNSLLNNAVNPDLSNLTATGNNHFTNKDMSNLTATGDNHFLNKNVSNATAAGKQQIENFAMPNFGAGVSAWSGFVAPKNGYIYEHIVLNGAHHYGYVGAEASFHGIYDWHSSFFPIPKGWTYSCSGDYSGTWYTFYPCIGG